MQINTGSINLDDNLQRYFWDTDLSKLDMTKKSEFVIARLLDKGNFQAVRWVIKNYSKQEIIKTLKTYRDFSLKSASFWALFYNIPLSELKCFQQPYRTTRTNLWPY